jgi:dTDP-4-dehydrorhamnose reductase
LKIVLLGSSGFLGSYLSKSLNPNYDIFKSNRHDFFFNDGEIDISPELKLKIRQSDICINCIADTNMKSCEDNLEENIANVKIPQVIAKNITKKNYLIHFSSDIFYESTCNNSNENMKINCNNSYASQKKSAEEIFLSKNAVIIRTSFYGDNPRKIGLLNHVIKSIKENTRMEGWKNVYSSSVHISNLIELIDFIIRNYKKIQISGIYNYGTQKSYSKYYFAERIFDSFGLQDLLKGIDFIQTDIPRNINSGICSEKIQRDFGIKLPSVDEVINLSIRDIKKT